MTEDCDFYLYCHTRFQKKKKKKKTSASNSSRTLTFQLLQPMDGITREMPPRPSPESVVMNSRSNQNEPLFPNSELWVGITSTTITSSDAKLYPVT